MRRQPYGARWEFQRPVGRQSVRIVGLFEFVELPFVELFKLIEFPFVELFEFIEFPFVQLKLVEFEFEFVEFQLQIAGGRTLARLGALFRSAGGLPRTVERRVSPRVAVGRERARFLVAAGWGMRRALVTGQMARPGCRLLFVDDEETILFAVHDYFELHGYEVDATTDAESAQALLDTHAYAAAVIDLSLGRGKETMGLELVRRLRERHPHTAVILFTACSTPDVVSQALRSGAVVLEKPQPLFAVESAIEQLRQSGIS